jgi:phospholipid transport system substrate-binding protein
MSKFLSVLSLVCLLVTSGHAAEKSDKALTAEEQFVSDLGNKIITLIRSTDDLTQKKEYFRNLLQKHFDMKSIGKFVLSRFWRQANDQQKAEFLKLFEQNMVNTYTSQFNQYKDEAMVVHDSRKDEGDGAVWVNAKVQGSAREPVNIRWKLYNKGGQFKVYDIHVNEASMCITHRSEYASIIGAHGGQIDGLLQALKENKETRKNS